MAVNESVTKSVLFLGTKEDGKFKPRATAFIVSIFEEEWGWRFLVTAEHVIYGFTKEKCDIWVRSNLKNGTTIENKLSNVKWWFHPDKASNATDVAVTPVDFANDEDFLAIRLSQDISMAATDQVLRANNVHVGHEVYICDLFRSHYGQQKNVPIVRVGNIAMMLGEEKVFTKYCGYTDAYLIEARSIGGLSGSPVYINVPTHTMGSRLQIPGERTCLLGLMHGHFDVQTFTDDIVVDIDDGSGRPSGINTGIGVVIPVEKILETLSHPELVSMREEAKAELRRRKSGTDGPNTAPSSPTPVI